MSVRVDDSGRLAVRVWVVCVREREYVSTSETDRRLLRKCVCMACAHIRFQLVRERNWSQVVASRMCLI